MYHDFCESNTVYAFIKLAKYFEVKVTPVNGNKVNDLYCLLIITKSKCECVEGFSRSQTPEMHLCGCIPSANVPLTFRYLRGLKHLKPNCGVISYVSSAIKLYARLIKDHFKYIFAYTSYKGG